MSAAQDAPRVIAEPRLQTAVVPLPAEIDMTNDGQVETALIAALGDGLAVLVADGTGTTFCAASGTGALIRAHQQAEAAGTQLRVVAVSAIMRRVLEVTGADHLLDTYPSLADALAGRHPPSTNGRPLHLSRR